MLLFFHRPIICFSWLHYFYFVCFFYFFVVSSIFEQTREILEILNDWGVVTTRHSNHFVILNLFYLLFYFMLCMSVDNGIFSKQKKLKLVMFYWRFVLLHGSYLCCFFLLLLFFCFCFCFYSPRGAMVATIFFRMFLCHQRLELSVLRCFNCQN